MCGAFGRMDHLGQDHQSAGQRYSTIAQHGDLLHSDATLDGAPQTLPGTLSIPW
jgi:hypothetical protein